MYTVIETPFFQNLVSDYWDEDERGAFCAWLAANPDAGDVIPASGGCRKVRWSRPGTGRRGGVRVIYFNRRADGEIWLLTLYAKSARDNIAAHTLKALKELIDED
ncbi:MAG: type II toxin-antitoxin system RelE/ParE family toxin [Betaproteobacteria bacterium]|nr:type II toxin-antitoxin system RelE/ParE family toxin [Betaproteobacteria bacterium]